MICIMYHIQVRYINLHILIMQLLLTHLLENDGYDPILQRRVTIFLWQIVGHFIEVIINPQKYHLNHLNN